MGTINYGQQKISFNYKEPGQSQLFNNTLHKISPRGIYSGGAFTRINDTTVNIDPLICVFEDTTNAVTARIETTIAAGISVAPGTPYIVIRFQWLNTEGNYADIISTTFSGIQASDIILGRLNFIGSVMTTEYDYCRKHWASPYLNNIFGYTPDYLVVANEPYDTQVTVYPGQKNIINGKQSQLTVNTLSSAFSFPAGSNGRTDLVCLNESSQVVIVAGDNVVGSSVIPSVDDGYLLLAVITFPASASLVKGSYISYFNPKYLKSGQITGTNSSTFHLDKLNSGPILKNSSGVLQVRNTGDTAFARMSVADGLNINDAISVEQFTDTLYQEMGRPIGVLGGVDNSLNPTTTGALNSTYDTGVAVFKGYPFKNTVSTALTHVAPTSGYRRIDAVVVRFTNFAPTLTIIQGIEKNDGSQVAPGITSATDLLVSHVLIDGTSGNATTVTDKRPIITKDIIFPISPAGATTIIQSSAVGPLTLGITTGASNAPINFPPATGSGKIITLIKKDSGAGSVNAVPSGSDVMGSFGNTTVGMSAQYQAMQWIDNSSGQWTLLSANDGRPNFSHGLVVLTSGTSWTVPHGVYGIWVTTIGGGGGGGGGNYAVGNWGASGGGGGAGDINISYVNVTPSSAISYSIGSPGAGGAVGVNGSSGGNTTFTGATTSVGGSGGGCGTIISGIPTGGIGGGNGSLGQNGTASINSTVCIGGGGGGPKGGIGGNVGVPPQNGGEGSGGGGGGAIITNAQGAGAGGSGKIIIEY